ncbi:hypothetical protein ACGFX4_33545 [Kitasatospora sp. NPDC048365]|uniref:hypothetical protein n=1 Tax=Kitasatospora sp. NPDC048365 TaxID=3364050 RepID=UPI00371F1540
MTMYLVPPLPATAVPPRRDIPPFPPIRRGGGGRHRLQHAVRRRPGVLVTGLIAALTALAAGPLRPGPPPAAPPAGCAAASTGKIGFHP